MGACTLLALVGVFVVGAQPGAAVPSSTLVISQVYGGGGNTGAVLTHDYIEIFNRGSTLLDLNGWSVQYGSTLGNIGPNDGQITPLSGFVAPGQYVLIQEAQGVGGTTPLSPDITDSTPIAMSATGGKIALLNTTTGLNCGATATPCAAGALTQVVDLVGYDGANLFEQAPAPTLSNTTAALRLSGGCVDTDNNFGDFAAGAPTPRNRQAPPNVCPTGDPPTAQGFANPSTTPAGGTSLLTVNVTPGANPVSTGLAVTADLTAIGGVATQPFFDDGTNGDVTANDNVFTFLATVSPTTGQGVKSLPVTITDAQGRLATTTIFVGVTAIGPGITIHDIQGASHTSPRVDTDVSGVRGIVTGKLSNGFYFQDPVPDGDDATSEGIFVFTSSAPAVNVGDALIVGGHVQEFRPGGTASTNLTTTEISAPTISVVSSGNALPAPTVIGSGGRVPPDTVIDDDSFGTFDPASDGIDFYESLEGMRVQVNNATAVGPTNAFGEIPVVADGGASAGLRTPRGGVVIRQSDFNPERIQLDDTALANSTPGVNVGDGFTTAPIGVMDYSFGNFKLNLTAPLTRVDNGLAREVTTPAGTGELAVATFNLENIDPGDPQSKFDELASLFVHNLKAPDIVAVEEIQDNNGPTNDSVVDASQTFAKFIAAIGSAGGPSYEFRQIDPVDDQDGGEPGGNIRQGFLFRTDRGLQFVDRPGGGSTTSTSVVNGAGGPELSASPGRIDPTNAAFNSSRKPLAGEFLFNGTKLFVIANHFNSKGGDDPLFGRFQPPTRSSEAQRHQQAQIENDFVDSILSADPNANVVVAGDINDFQFSQTVDILEGGVLHDLVDDLPQAEQYSYDFEGNSQVLDHILVSGALFGRPHVYDPVHVNSEFFDQASDHDPSVARFKLNQPPAVDAGGPYAVAEGASTQLSATGSDPDGDSLTYAWDLDNDGSFETAGQTVTFSAAALDGPSTKTVAVRVSDGRLTDTGQAMVDVTNVAPTGSFSAPGSVFAGNAFGLALTDPADPSSADVAAGFRYAFDCGGGYGAFGTGSSASCPTSDTGTLSVGGKIRDKDGDVTEYRAQVSVVVTFASLCDLVKLVVTDAGVAKGLCDKLAAAAAAEPRGNAAKQNQLDAFRSQVDAQTGKSMSPANAELLKRLSTRL